MTLTPEGLDRPRLPAIKQDFDTNFIDALGPINTNADSVTGQIIGILSAAIDDVWEAVQDNYDSMYPYSAEGASLDGAVSFVGLERLPATQTTAVAMLYGTESTLVPSGVLVRSEANRQFFTTSDMIITRAAAGDVEIEVNTVSNSANYQIVAGGVSVVYTSDSDATEAEIIAGLAALFDPDDFIATAETGYLRVRSANQIDDFSISVDSKLTISRLGSPATFTAVDFGAYTLPANTLTRIDTSVIGWDEINNLVAGTTGRFVESDTDLRIRHRESVRVTGSSTVKAIKSRLLQEVPELTAAEVYENRKNIEVDGLPPHSFEVVVQGGSDQEIGNKIFEVKPAGIETYGNTDVQVLDDNGDIQIMNFSRATTLYAWVRVSVNLLNPEEPLTTTAAAAISDAVLEFGATLSVGDDIIPQRFYGGIYAATTGISNITVEVDATANPGDVPTYTTNTVPIARAEIAKFDATRIVVVGV